MANYARELPLDKMGSAYPSPPAQESFKSSVAAGASQGSSVLTLDDRTTVLDVMVVGAANGNAGAVGRWGPTSVTTLNYDFMVNSGQTRTFVVPQSVAAGITSVMGANGANGLYNSVSFIPVGAGSVSILTAQY